MGLKYSPISEVIPVAIAESNNDVRSHDIIWSVITVLSDDNKYCSK